MKNHSQYLINTIRYAFVLLFTYAAVSKILDFENFQVQLGQSPLLNEHPEVMAYCIIIALLITVLLLCFGKAKKAGLYSTLIFASLSMLYIGIVLINKYNLPCTCIAFFEKLSWKSNLWFCAGIDLVAFISLCITKNSEYQPSNKN